jgi:hypothetical protein
MDVTKIVDHLNQLQKIADINQGSRTALTGYNASVEYIINQLKQRTNLSVRLIIS